MFHISRSRKHAAGPLIAVGPRWSGRVAMALAALGMLTLLAAAPAGAAAGPTSHSRTTSDGGSWVADVPAAGNGTLNAKIEGAPRARAPGYAINYAQASNWLARPSSPKKKVDVSISIQPLTSRPARASP
jgi:hypothetical protein